MKPLIMDTPGGRFRFQRMKAGLSAQEVAKDSDCNQVTVYRFENNEREPSYLTFFRMCFAVNADPFFIAFGELRVEQMMGDDSRKDTQRPVKPPTAVGGHRVTESSPIRRQYEWNFTGMYEPYGVACKQSGPFK